MKFSNQTRLYISASYKPGNFGSTLYNSLFEQLGINAVYLSRKVTNAKELIAAVKTLNIAGCSVSMPMKSLVIPYLDSVDPLAKELQSVNTIVNNEGTLKGFNTDYVGAYEALKGLNIEPDNIVIFGAGSVVNSLVRAAKSLGIRQIAITSRDNKKAQAVSRQHNIDFLAAEDLPGSCQLLVNATPASHSKSEASYTRLSQLLERSETLFDLVVSAKETDLVSEARSQNKGVVPGIEMSKHQLAKQFEIYTGQICPMDALEQSIQDAFLL